jgi:hypothetical protein
MVMIWKEAIVAYLKVLYISRQTEEDHENTR